jgi:hypothetical protein
VLRYEQLCAAPEDTLREVCAFLGETYVAEMAAALDGASLGDAGAPGAEGRPQGAVAAFIERYAAPQLRAHAYTTTPRPAPRALRATYYLIDLPCNRACLTAWLITHPGGSTSEAV